MWYICVFRESMETSHLVAQYKLAPKVKKAEKEGKIIIIRKDWFVDCAKCRMKLMEGDYLLL
jgi:hypothetical protein